jgi:hypothetical protein
MNFDGRRRVQPSSDPEDHEMRADFAILAKDYPDVRLVADVKPKNLSPAELDQVVNQIARYMWGNKCHYGLIFTPQTTYVLRDDFITQGPEAIHVSATLSTEKLFGRLGVRWQPATERELEFLVRDWLNLLSDSYDSALGDDPEVTQALFPEIVGAAAEGRVVAEGAFQ